MEIKILGTGCPKCDKLAAETKLAAEEMELDFTITKVTKVMDIIGYGVVLTPALVVDGEVKFSGKVPSRDDIKKMLTP
jgi:small redox-active disulfide protein 2